MQKLMTVKVKQEVPMEASALGSQGWAWLTPLQLPPARTEGRWALASPPCPLPNPPRQEGHTSVARAGEEMEKPRVTQGSARGKCCCALARTGARGGGCPAVVFLSTRNPHGRRWPCGTPWSPFLFNQKEENRQSQKAGGTRRTILMIWEVSSVLALFLHPSWV